jgi:hypothetical protein
VEDSAPLRREVGRTTDTNESQAGLRLRLAVVEAAIERVSSDRLRYAELIKDLEDLRGRLLAALDELSAD